VVKAEYWSSRMCFHSLDSRLEARDLVTVSLELVPEPLISDSERVRVPSPLSAILVWLGALCAVVMASVGTASVAVAVMLASGKLRASELQNPAASPLISNPAWFIVGAIATQVSVALVLVVTVWLGKLERRVVLPLVRVPSPAFAGALLVVFGLAPLAQVVGELTSRLFHLELKASIIVSNMAERSNSLEFATLLVCLSVLPALVEESMFRGYMTAAFARRSFLARVFVPSVLFGIFHLEPTQATATVILGVGFALARLYSGSLLPGMLAHGIYNGVVLTVARLLPNADDHEIRALPLLIGAGLFTSGFLTLRRRSATSRDAYLPS
jgi:membrane protease YdiL (CAAX protease family)